MTKFRDDDYYENQVDKRTKEYKQWRKFKEEQLERDKNKIKGVGDVVEKITEATGIKAVVKSLFGEDCGCTERKNDLNELLPIGLNAVNCIEEDDYYYLQSFFSRRRTRVNVEQQKTLVRIYNYVFNKREVIPSACVGCSQKGFIKLVRNLENYYNSAQVLVTEGVDEEE